MKKVKVLLDSVGYITKPKTHAAEITNRLTKQHNERKEVELTIEELAKSLGKGQTAILATYLDKDKRLSDKNEIEQQQVLFLDIDNTNIDEEFFTIEDMLKDSFILDNASFYYKSFSHAIKGVDKFRVAFVLDEKVTNKTVIRQIYTALLKKYKQADQELKNTNRLFFGGRSGYSVIDLKNTLNVSELKLEEVEVTNKKTKTNTDKKAVKKVEKRQTNIKNKEYVYELLRLNKYEEVKQIVLDRYKTKLAANYTDVTSAITVLQSQIDIVEFLDLPTTNPFIDVLHEEESASASVFTPIDSEGIESDYMLYKVFSTSQPVLYDLVNLISKLTGLNSRYKAGKLLVYITGSELVDSGNIVEIKKSLMFISKMFRNDTQMKLLYPNTHNILRYISHLCYEVIDIMVDYTTEDIKTGEVRVVNFLSHEALAKMLTKNTNLYIDKNKTRRVIDALVFLNLIKKLKDSEIPENLLNSVVSYKESKGNERRSNLYELVLPKEDYIESLEFFCTELVKIKFTLTSNLNGDFLYRYFGAQETLRVFPQFKTHKKETLSDNIEEVLSKDSLQIEKAATKFMINKIEKQGYVLEKEVKNYLTRYYKKTFSEAKFKTIKYSIIENYNIKRLKVNSELKETYKMKNAKPNMFCYTK